MPPRDARSERAQGQATRRSTCNAAVTAPVPATSTINVRVGDNRANGVDVGLAANGSLSAVWVGNTSTATTHAIFDVTGYFR